MSLSTPVAFIIFNRPDLTQIVFNAIRQAQPKQLFVIADGARFPEETEKCQLARDVIKQVDWDCKVLTNYADNNLGCRQRVSSGINWVFEQVEEAIILEDDCLPHPDFFPYCSELLERYRNDTRIMQIGGSNFFKSTLDDYYQYFFSRHTTSWGWATWTRAWKHYDKDLHLFDMLNSRGQLADVWPDSNERMVKKRQILDVMNNVIDTWDYIWSFSCASQKAFSILPAKNLIKNIGFDLQATHTKIQDERALSEISELSISTHPKWIYNPIDIEIERLSRFTPIKNSKIKSKIYGLIKTLYK